MKFKQWLEDVTVLENLWKSGSCQNLFHSCFTEDSFVQDYS